MSDTTKVFIVDTNEPALLMLNLWLDNIENLEIVGSSLAKEDFASSVNESQADVVIYNWNLTKKGYRQIKQLKKRDFAPAFIAIKDGNFLPLEGVMNQTPETLIPTTATLNSLVNSIERNARKRDYASTSIEMELEKAC